MPRRCWAPRCTGARTAVASSRWSRVRPPLLPVPKPETLVEAWRRLKPDRAKLDRQLQQGLWVGVAKRVDEALLVGACGVPAVTSPSVHSGRRSCAVPGSAGIHPGIGRGMTPWRSCDPAAEAAADQRAAVVAQWGHPQQRWQTAHRSHPEQGVTQWFDVQQEWLDLMWCLDQYRIADAPPHGMGKPTLDFAGRMDGIYRGKGNRFATTLTLLLNNRTGQILRSRSEIKGFSQNHQIDLAWPDRKRRRWSAPRASSPAGPRTGRRRAAARWTTGPTAGASSSSARPTSSCGVGAVREDRPLGCVASECTAQGVHALGRLAQRQGPPDKMVRETSAIVVDVSRWRRHLRVRRRADDGYVRRSRRSRRGWRHRHGAVSDRVRDRKGDLDGDAQAARFASSPETRYRQALLTFERPLRPADLSPGARRASSYRPQIQRFGIVTVRSPPMVNRGRRTYGRAESARVGIWRLMRRLLQPRDPMRWRSRCSCSPRSACSSPAFSTRGCFIAATRRSRSSGSCSS